MKSITSIGEFLKTWKKFFIFASLLSCFINFLGLTFTFYMYTIYDVIVTSFSESSLITITIIAFYALGMLVLFLFIRHKLLVKAGLSLDASLSGFVLENMLKISSFPLKGGYRRGIQDIRQLRDFFSSQGLFAIFDAPWAPFYLILICCMHRMLGIASIIGALLIFLLSILQEKLCQNVILKANKIQYENSRYYESIFQNSEAVVGMGMISPVIKKWSDKDIKILQLQKTASNRAGLIQAIFKGIQLLLQISIYGIGAYYVIKREITPGLMILASILEGQATRPIIQFMFAYRQSVASWEAYKRLQSFLYFSNTLVEQENRSLQVPEIANSIEVKNIFFGLQGRLILKGINFDLKKGDYLGLIGPSGAGKSSLAKILAGIWHPNLGQVCLNGIDMRHWPKPALGKLIGYLPQEIHLFPGTIAENICIKEELIDKEKLKNLLQELELWEFISNLPKGLDTDIKEIILSGGQKQRLGFARAIYFTPKILILDEPNSNLDEHSEQVLLNFLKKLKNQKNTICILISHTPQILSIVNKILVIHNGQKIDFGPQEKVLKNLRTNITPSAPKLMKHV